MQQNQSAATGGHTRMLPSEDLRLLEGVDFAMA